jgi:pyruvate,water dikinase
MEVLPFAEATCRDVARAGGKGASLARMAALDLPVPPGFVVPASCLAGSLPDGGRELRSLLGDADERRRAAVAERARAIVAAAELPGELRASIERAYARLGEGDVPLPARPHAGLGEGDVPVAVRSSACAEDSESASFAGQQETYLHVRGAGDVIRRVRDCWASFFSERALFYRARKGSLDDLGMAVVVQRMVDADVAGVLFTIDPTKGRRDRMLVEAVFGLGEAVVSGEVTPDHYVLARDGALKRTQLTTQPYAVVRDPAGGVREQPLDEERGRAQTLDEDQLRALAEIGRDLEERLGRPQDIEWAIEHGRLYVLQARPVTA